MEIWVTLWCRRDVRRFRLDLSFDVAVSAGREMRSLSGGSRRSALGADQASLPDPHAVTTIGCTGAALLGTYSCEQREHNPQECEFSRGCYDYPA
jgi:hypothetical protein